MVDGEGEMKVLVVFKALRCGNVLHVPPFVLNGTPVHVRFLVHHNASKCTAMRCDALPFLVH